MKLYKQHTTMQWVSIAITTFFFGIGLSLLLPELLGKVVFVGTGFATLGALLMADERHQYNKTCAKAQALPKDY